MVAHIYFEFLPQPALLPIGEEVTVVVEERAAAQIYVSDQHSTEVANVADVVSRFADSAKKFNGAHDDHENAHGNSHWEREDPYLPVWHEYGACEQHSVNGAGCADRGRKRISPAAQGEQRLHDHGDDARAHSTQEEIGVEAACAPAVFQVRAEHGQEQKIQQHMENAGVQENIGERLPDKSVGNAVGNQSKIKQPEIPARRTEK